MSKQFLARGGKVTEGVSVVELNSTYHWKSVPDTSLAVGIVVPVGDTDETIAEQATSLSMKNVSVILPCKVHVIVKLYCI